MVSLLTANTANLISWHHVPETIVSRWGTFFFFLPKPKQWHTCLNLPKTSV